MAGKGKHGKGKKKKPKKSNHGQTEKPVKHVDEEHDQNGENNESGIGGKTNEKNGESQKNEVLGKGDCELLDVLNINSPNQIDSRAKLPNHLPSAEESAFLKGYMEEAIAKCPVHSPDCGHPSHGRDIEDCDLCWAIAAMESLYVALKFKGADDKLISLNYDLLLDCYGEEKTGYPHIIKKAFKFIKEHNVCKHAFYPEAKPNMRKLNVPEEVKALRICGFQMVENDDEFEIMRSLRKVGPLVGGVRQSPEFAMLGTKIYEGSANEIMIDGKYCKHGVLVYGFNYDEKEDRRFWIIKNSDGTRWGDEGWGKVARESSSYRGPLLTSTMYPIFQ